MKIMCLWGNDKKKIYRKKIIYFASRKPLKKGAGSEVGSGSISQRYGSGGSGSAPKCHGSPTLPERVTHRSWYRLKTNFLRADLSRLGVAATAARFVGSLALYSTTWRAEHETSLLQGKDTTAWRSTPLPGGLSMRPACSKVRIQPG
jgi:hypothetical protein